MLIYPFVYAENSQSQKLPITESIETQPRSVAGVAIFFGGIVVGWVADGVISYATGKSPAEWTKIGLEKIESSIKNLPQGATRVEVDAQGRVKYCYPGGCQIE